MTNLQTKNRAPRSAGAPWGAPACRGSCGRHSCTRRARQRSKGARPSPGGRGQGGSEAECVAWPLWGSPGVRGGHLPGGASPGDTSVPLLQCPGLEGDRPRPRPPSPPRELAPALRAPLPDSKSTQGRQTCGVVHCQGSRAPGGPGRTKPEPVRPHSAPAAQAVGTQEGASSRPCSSQPKPHLPGPRG